MNKQSRLDRIAREIENRDECKLNKIGLPVPGEGNPDAEIVFLGEAPGKTEAATGRPFIGRSGKLLRKMINETGINEKDVFITSPVKRLPVYGTPKPADIRHGRVHLQKQLEVISPKMIVLLGSVAAKAALSKPVATLKQHGTVIEENGIKYLVTIHPAAGLRFPPLKELIKSDFLKLRALVKRE